MEIIEIRIHTSTTTLTYTHASLRMYNEQIMYGKFRIQRMEMGKFTKSLSSLRWSVMRMQRACLTLFSFLFFGVNENGKKPSFWKILRSIF
jgi:hypothetical protein